jgi:Fe2+ transport system protein FeoA
MIAIPLMPLECLPVGQRGVVAEVVGPDALVAGLAARGLHVGSRCEVLTAGEPMLLRIGDTRLSLRTDRAVDILIRPEAG